jgi:hypothetical protein
MADGENAALRSSTISAQFFQADKFQTALELIPGHRSGFDGTAIILTQPLEILSGQIAKFCGRSYATQRSGQIANSYAPMPQVAPVSQSATCTANSSNAAQRQSLKDFHEA